MREVEVNGQLRVSIIRHTVHLINHKLQQFHPQDLGHALHVGAGVCILLPLGHRDRLQQLADPLKVEDDVHICSQLLAWSQVNLVAGVLVRVLEHRHDDAHDHDVEHRRHHPHLRGDVVVRLRVWVAAALDLLQGIVENLQEVVGKDILLECPQEIAQNEAPDQLDAAGEFVLDLRGVVLSNPVLPLGCQLVVVGAETDHLVLLQSHVDHEAEKGGVVPVLVLLQMVHDGMHHALEVDGAQGEL
mmetsp:Transcript_61338/g.197642  ORF Transcript_61338/g.197642 Transcript_61338/m.197642 type:complete len:244 (-) Transcript_61338:1146-1877(-)